MNLSPFAQTALRDYQRMRQAAPHADLCLLAGASYYMARFGCAKLCSSTLDPRRLQDHGEGYFTYAIPMEDVQRSIAKLAEHHSVALLDTITDEHGTRFVCIWKVEKSGGAASQPVSTNVDDY